MVTSKRRVGREEPQVSATATKEKSQATFNDELMMYSYLEQEPLPVEPTYLSDVEVKPKEKPEKVAVKTTMRLADVLPEITRENVTERKTETVTVAKEKPLTPAMKKVLVTYLCVVLFLTAAVIATGVILSGINAQIGTYESQIAQMNQTMALQEATLESLSDPEVIMSKAEGLGMVSADVSVTSPLVSVSETETVTDTNWFDALCEWLGGLFGG